jgi:hypothetical protein
MEEEYEAYGGKNHNGYSTNHDSVQALSGPVPRLAMQLRRRYLENAYGTKRQLLP